MEGFDAVSEHNPDQKLSSETIVVTEQELAHATKESYKTWKPFSLSSGTLIATALFTGGLVVVLGILQWQNTRHGALFFASTANGFTLLEDFLYRYLPTIVVVLYSLAWSWIDLDIMRLEPWFQLARSGGASADSSLLLQYPADFLPLVPLKAAKLRHWVVFSASTVTILVSWGVLPLQNGIFSTGTIVVPSVTSLHTTNSFLPVKDQSAKLGGNILNTAYSIVWLGQEMLPFTTSEYTLAPFDAAQSGSALSYNQTLTASTLLYSTDLSCRPPSQVLKNKAPTLTFDDGQGCVAQDLLPIADNSGALSRFAGYYIGYYDDANVDSSLQLAGCPIQASHETLVIWKLASSTDAPNFHNSSNATALFCTPSYYSQSVNATVTIPDRKVLSVQPVGPKVPLTDKEFNTTHFETLLANGIPAQDSSSPRQDISAVANIHQDSRLRNMSLTVPTANMIAFAVGSTQLAPEAYLNPSTLQMAVQRAHRLLFSIAVQTVLSSPRLNSSAVGHIHSQLQAVSLVPVFTYLATGVLILITIFTLYLLKSTASRPSSLSRDPDTLAQVMSLSRNPELQRLFMPSGAAGAPRISKTLQSYNFEMLASHEEAQPIIKPNSITDDATSSDGSRKLSHDISREDSLIDERFTQPIMYNRAVGILFSVSLAGAVAALIYMHQKMRLEDGLPLPSHNVIVQQIILNLLPTAAATTMEPVWGLVTRVVCIMQPLEELNGGHAPARKSLLLKYTALPPQLVSWRALRAGHFFLAALCVVTILANLLTVALSGLFTQVDVFTAQNTQLSEIYQQRLPSDFETSQGTDVLLSAYSQNDPFYVAMANFSGVTSLPPWTTSEYGFFPLDLGSSLSRDDSTHLELQYIGYGLDLECQELTETSSEATYNLTFNPDSSVAKLVTSHKQSNGSEILCIPYAAVLNSNGTPGGEGYMAVSGNPAGHQAFEFAAPMTTFENNYDNPDFISSAPYSAIVDDSSFCNSLIVMGWVRANTTVAQPRASSPTTASTSVSALPDTSSMALSKTFISCQPRLKSALFDLMVSSSGAIKAATQNATALYGQIPANSSLWTSLNQTMAAFGDVTPAWHNDTFATDWFNDLAKTFTNSTALLDVTVPPPNASVASNLASNLYSRIFAIQMALLTPQLLPATADSKQIPARRMTAERKVFMSEPLFYISITILVLDLVVAIVFYCRLPAPFLPRMPTNIANQIAFFAGSRMMDDVQNAGGDLRELDRQGFRYGYGRYLGKDGKVHLGIEREPYVTRLTKTHTGARWWACLG